jgi:hypothetical protein
MGAYPKIILKHKKTGATKSVRIDQWKVSTIHEFLKGKLELSKGKNKRLQPPASAVEVICNE